MGSYIIWARLLVILTALPIAWKAQLGMLRVGLTVVLLALLAAGVVGVAAHPLAMTTGEKAGLVWLLAIVMAVGLLAYRFYLDPERRPPDRNDAIVSPADAMPIYAPHSEHGILPVSPKNGHTYRLSGLAH